MEIEEYVKNILNDIKSGGIDAVSEYSKKFDGYGMPFKVPESEFAEANELIPEYQKDIINRTYKRIYENHAIQYNNDKVRFFRGSIYGIRYPLFSVFPPGYFFS